MKENKEKEVYEQILKKGYDNYFNFCVENERENLNAIDNLIKEGNLKIKEIEYSTFVRPSKQSVIDVYGYSEEEYYTYKNATKLDTINIYRNERDNFLSFISERVIVDGEIIEEQYQNNYLKKFGEYLNRIMLGSSWFYCLNPLGYKHINKKYDSNLIDFSCLKFVKEKSKEEVFPTDLNYVKMINILKIIYNGTFLTPNMPQWKDYDRYALKLKSLNLIDYEFSSSKKIAILSRKGFDFVKEDTEKYNSYLKRIRLEYLKRNNENILSKECVNLIKRLIAGELLEIKHICLEDDDIKNLVENQVEMHNAFGRKYISLKKSVLNIYNERLDRDNLYNSIIRLSKSMVAADVDLSFEKSMIGAVLNFFNLTYKGNGKNPKYYGLDKITARYIGEVKSISVVFAMAQYYTYGYIEMKNIGKKTYAMISEKGCQYFNINFEYKDNKEIFEKFLKQELYRPIISEVYDQRLVSKLYYERLYGKSVYDGVKNYLKEVLINDKVYLEVNKRGFKHIGRSKHNNKSNIKSSLQLNVIENASNFDEISKFESKIVLDKIDKTILKAIYKEKVCRLDDIHSFAMDRFKRLYAHGLIEKCIGKNFIALTQKACSLINASSYKIPTNLYSHISKSERVAYSYFFKKDLATDCLRVLEMNNVTGATNLKNKCQNILKKCTQEEDKRNSKLCIRSEEKLLILAVHLKNSAFKKETLDSVIYEKFKRLKIFKSTKSVEYIGLSKKGIEIAKQTKKNKNTDFESIIKYIDSKKILYKNIIIETKALSAIKSKKVKKASKSCVQGGRKVAAELFENIVRYKFGGVNKENIDKHLNFIEHGEYVVFDTEFSSEYGNGSNLIEIGAVKIKNGKIVDTMSCLIDTFRKRLLNYVSGLTRITKEMLKSEGISEERALEEFIGFIGDMPVIAHEIKNDWHESILLGCANNQITLPTNEIIDSVEIFKILFPTERYGLDTLIKKYALKSDSIPRHRALGDSVYTFNALIKAVESIKKVEPIVIKTKNVVYENVG